MIDVLATIRTLMLNEATIVAEVGQNIYAGEIPTGVTDSWDRPEDVTQILYLDAEVETRGEAPVVEGTVYVECLAASLDEAARLAGVVVDALDDHAKVEIDGDHISYIDLISGPTPSIDEEFGWCSCAVGFAVLIID